MIFHYVPIEAFNANGRLARAACGRLVNPKKEHAAEPDCERCREWIRKFEAMNVGQDAPSPAPGVGR